MPDATSRSQYIVNLARELLDDIELSRLPAEALLLKAIRLARLAGSDAPERDGQQFDGRAVGAADMREALALQDAGDMVGQRGRLRLKTGDGMDSVRRGRRAPHVANFRVHAPDGLGDASDGFRASRSSTPHQCRSLRSDRRALGTGLAWEFAWEGPKARFFAATVMAGKLYVEGIPDRDPWDARLVFQDETIVDLVLMPGTGDRKVRTSEDLEIALRESESRPSAFRVWIHEALVEVARAIWTPER